MTDSKHSDFAAKAASHKDQGLLREISSFLWVNRKWWMIPVFITLLLMSVLIFLGGTAAAPFIYTLF